jgi:hypothetical protein
MFLTRIALLQQSDEIRGGAIKKEKSESQQINI